MPKQAFPAAAEGMPFETRINRLFEEVESQAHALRCMALLTDDQINSALFPGLRRPEDSDFFYVDDELRNMIGYVIAVVVEKATLLEREIVALSSEWRKGA